jgi:hypothetical protein
MSTRDDSRLTHPLNVGYLVVGLVCLGIAGLWALHAADVVDTAQVGWLLPLTLVVAGVIGLVALAARGLTRRSGTDESYEHESYDQSYEGAYDDDVTDLATLQASAYRYPTGEDLQEREEREEPEQSEQPEATAVLPDAEHHGDEPTTRIDPEGGSR